MARAENHHVREWAIRKLVGAHDDFSAVFKIHNKVIDVLAQMTSKVIDVLALLGHRCLGTHR